MHNPNPWGAAVSYSSVHSHMLGTQVCQSQEEQRLFTSANVHTSSLEMFMPNSGKYSYHGAKKQLR